MKAGKRKKVVLVPCSGIGKALGSVSREATYEVVENLRKGVTDTTCLALIVRGDEETLKLVKNNRCIAVDGCPLQCAAKNVELAGGDLAASFRVVDTLRENRKLKPKSVTFLDHDGQELANLLAEQVAQKVDELLKR
ncbi:putative zinc-binding protein [Candidatus Bathyarchaeota archaeon]|nr:putative zinc-binding protein [Candidatus Bathyarchaeota archaeon]